MQRYDGIRDSRSAYDPKDAMRQTVLVYISQVGQVVMGDTGVIGEAECSTVTSMNESGVSASERTVYHKSGGTVAFEAVLQ